MEENKVKKRGWVKNAAIIFLSILLVLTFFSQTILNRSLPEVSTASVSSDTINARIRGSGTVTAGDTYEVVLGETRTVEAVYVKVGDAVAVGDKLFLLADKDSTELTQAQEQLATARRNYQSALTDLLDALYCLFLAAALLAFTLRIGQGELRLYMLAFIALGAYLSFALLSPLLRPLWDFWADCPCKEESYWCLPPTACRRLRVSSTCAPAERCLRGSLPPGSSHAPASQSRMTGRLPPCSSSRSPCSLTISHGGRGMCRKRGPDPTFRKYFPTKHKIPARIEPVFVSFCLRAADPQANVPLATSPRPLSTPIAPSTAIRMIASM